MELEERGGEHSRCFELFPSIRIACCFLVGSASLRRTVTVTAHTASRGSSKRDCAKIRVKERVLPDFSNSLLKQFHLANCAYEPVKRRATRTKQMSSHNEISDDSAVVRFQGLNYNNALLRFSIVKLERDRSLSRVGSKPIDYSRLETSETLQIQLLHCRFELRRRSGRRGWRSGGKK